MDAPPTRGRRENALLPFRQYHTRAREISPIWSVVFLGGKVQMPHAFIKMVSQYGPCYGRAIFFYFTIIQDDVLNIQGTQGQMRSHTKWDAHLRQWGLVGSVGIVRHTFSSFCALSEVHVDPTEWTIRGLKTQNLKTLSPTYTAQPHQSKCSERISVIWKFQWHDSILEIETQAKKRRSAKLSPFYFYFVK